MNTLRIRSVPRWRDEELLGWLEMQNNGISIAEIARRTGKTEQNVGQEIRNVRAEMEPDV